MSSLRRINSSRANGRRSHGPVTPEGKRRSSMNAIDHGLLAKIVLMKDESPEAFQHVVEAHELRLQPADDVEGGFIEEMAAAHWRLRRAWAMSTRMLDNHVETQTNPNCLDRMSAVYTDPDIQRRLDLMMRYETRLHRMYQRAFQNLLVLRDMTVPNEPSPINGHLPPQLPPAPPEPDPAAQAPDPEPLPAAQAPAAQSRTLDPAASAHRPARPNSFRRRRRSLRPIRASRHARRFRTSRASALT